MEFRFKHTRRHRAAMMAALGTITFASLHAQRGTTGDVARPRLASYTQRAWTVENGLPQGSIYDLAQTPDGYLWLATYGGLVRFDGLRFSTIDVTTLPSLASNQIQALAPAKEGGLWVAPVGANVFRTDGRRELQSLPARADTQQRIRRLAVSPDGAIWTASDTVVERYAGGRWTTFGHPRWQSRPLRTLAIDHAGVVWIGTAGGVFRIDGDRCAPFDIDGLDEDADVRTIFEDRSRRLWIGGLHGLVALGSDGPKRRTMRVPGIDLRVTTVAQGLDGVIWVGAADGVYILSDGAPGSDSLPRRLASTDSLGDSVVVHFLTTRSGAIVAGTTDNGFRVFTHRTFELLGLAQGLPGIRVHHLADDGTGGLWVGAGCDGLARVTSSDANTVTVYVPPAMGLRSPCVRGLLRDRSGALWIGQAGGALTRAGADGSTQTWDTMQGLPTADIGPLLEDREGRIWIGTTSGVVCRVELDDRVKCPVMALADPPQVVWSLAEGEDGSVWIGQVGRLTRVSTKGTTTWTSAQGIPVAPIRVLKTAPDSTLWLGTYGAGLARFRGDRIRSITTKQGLFDNAISALAEGESGAVWLLGNRGVFVTRWADLEAVADGRLVAVDGTTFGPADGVPEGNGGHPASQRLGDRRLAFATVHGLAVFAPDHDPSSGPVAVVIEDVIGGDRSTPDGEVVTVPPGGGPVEIRFAAPSIGAPGSIRLRYQLSGRDASWVDAGTDRRAIYSDLAPGLFGFRVSSRHAGGPWSDPVTAVTLRVVPLWWQTRVARGGAILAGLLGVVGLVHLRLRAVERRSRELCREIRERQLAEEAARRHLLSLAHVGRLATAGELAASLAHELGQPLTAILANAEATKMMLTAPSPDRERIGEILDSIGQQARRASDVIRGLRTFLARGAPELVEVDVNALVRGVMNLMDSTLASARVPPTLELADGLPRVQGDSVPLQQVVINLALNAAEAMRERPAEQRSLIIRTRHTPRHVRVSVIDNGPGLANDHRAPALFEPFHTTKPGGMGMGLPICRSIVEAHGGRIRGRNRPTGGAVFSFTLPVGSRSDS